MALDVQWPTPATPTGLITIPKADTTLVSSGPPEIRSFNIDQFRLDLGDLWASAEGSPYSRPFTHTRESTVSGFTYARQVVIEAPYRVEFEDGQYVVQLFGANNNLLDVISSNQVSVQSQNSAGLVNVLQLYQSAYLGAIWIDTVNGVAGTSFQAGNGTPGKPVDNLADALTLSAQTGLRQLVVVAALVAIGESGDNPSDFRVNATDEIGARNNPHGTINPAPLDDAYDYNRDKRVNATDQIISRNNATGTLTKLKTLVVD